MLRRALVAVDGPDPHGSRPQMPAPQRLMRAAKCNANHPVSPRQRGAALIEFTVVGPIITLLGLAVLQYGMLFFAKNQINHATFMAARAGSTGNASLSSVRQAYERSLIPLYGGGRNQGELNEALDKAQADINKNVRIELLNPTRESFDDWHDPALRQSVGKGSRVIPNAGLAYRNPNDIGASSGQNIHDANLIKLRITHGYEPKVPLMKLIYGKTLRWLDTKGDTFYTKLVNAGRIPVVSHVTLHMQSDAIEPLSPVSIPGMGNNGKPTDPGGPQETSDPAPNCLSIACTAENTHPASGGVGSDTDTDGGTPPCAMAP